MATQKGRNWSSGDIVTAANLSSIERGVSAVAENYTPTTWANGNTGTAAALNNIEQGIANAGGGSWQTVFEGSVTTEEQVEDALGTIEGVSEITADTIKVTFNGTEYTCEKVDDGYGDSTFSEYPFFIESWGGHVFLHTPTAGTYTLKIEEQQSGGSSDFSTAEVTIVSPYDLPPIAIPTIYDGDGYNWMECLFYPGDSSGETYIVPLYKGSCVVATVDGNAFEGTKYTGTGGVHVVEVETDLWDIYIDGNGTLTYNSAL